MRYAIAINPVSGETPIEKKRSLLEDASNILEAPVFGFETESVSEFVRLCRNLSREFDVIVVAGGDGTFSEVINALDLQSVILAYLPLGSGNALKSALGYEGTIADIAKGIKEGGVHSYDLINCSGKRKAFMVSVVIEGVIVKLRERYLEAGFKGLQSYLIPTLDAYFWRYRRFSAVIRVDERELVLSDLVSVMIMKQPYFGYRMNVVPDARFDDGMLHVMCISSPFAELLFGALSSFTTGNRIGSYYSGKKVTMSLDRPMEIQIDGNPGWKDEFFEFEVLEGCLRIKH